ncbi:MAG TPA: stage IV sporulation protein A [Clostridiales bacterium]|nr:MAG: stage IV sporulation protein A [Clostridiales bacterium GWD2_32_19]HCC06606.1 stage IV sporulation protein A [Clostridiales bacterium]
MENFNIYKDIAERTNGDIYIGVVGPVRTGKSTFIKRFMDLFVIPNIENNFAKERAQDELPQSSDGTTIMTTEPKFIPNESALVTLNDDISFKLRMIDCVGYVVKGANGHFEGENPRMVHTPWSEDDMPFEKAAEMGTYKVISDHSTIGLVVTTDGSITGIPRENYEEAEEKTISQLKAINKPFVILLNSRTPHSESVQNLAKIMTEKHGTYVMPINCLQLKREDVTNILEKILYEFPMQEMRINFPKWLEGMDDNYWLKKNLIDYLKVSSEKMMKISDVKKAVDDYSESDYVKKTYLNSIDLAQGVANVDLSLLDELFYEVISDTAGIQISSDTELISILKKLADIKQQYEKVSYALAEVEQKGYGIVIPKLEELTLDDPQIIRQGNKFGVKLRARGPSLHIIKANIETEISPIVGTEEQSQDLLDYLTGEVEKDPRKIWNSNLFGKPLHELVSGELQSKINKMTYDSQERLQETLQRVINDGSGNLICIVL